MSYILSVVLIVVLEYCIDCDIWVSRGTPTPLHTLEGTVELQPPELLLLYGHYCKIESFELSAQLRSKG